MDFIEVMDRLAIIIEQIEGKKPYDKTIAEKLDLTPTNFANMKKRNSIPYEELALFCGKNKVSLNWVLLNQNGRMIADYEEEVWNIRYIDRINPSCGGGAYDDENPKIKYLRINKEAAQSIGITNPKNVEAITITGDSMYPTIKENATVLIDRTKSQFEEGGIFVINTNNGLFVKRLSLNPNGGVDLISDNKIYSTTTMLAEEVIIIGKVVASLEKK